MTKLRLPIKAVVHRFIDDCFQDAELGFDIKASAAIYHNHKYHGGRWSSLGISVIGTRWDVVKIEVLTHMISGNKQHKRRGSKVLIEGQIVSRDMRTVIDVKIRDISANGALLRMPSNVKLPEKFSLLVVSEGTLYPARKRWRKGERLELQFVGEPTLTAPRQENIS